MSKFILDRSFEEKINGVAREKKSVVPTRYGEVFAYQNVYDNKPEPEKYTTVCPGFYNGELAPESSLKEAELIMAAEENREPPPAKFFRTMDLLQVPEEKRPGAEEDLRNEGYRGPIKW